jgi:diguanylate cyclase (GGDEF)-like protein
MTLHLPTLLFACIAALAVPAALVSLFGATQRVYRGFWWWTAAQWFLVIGLALNLARDSHPTVLPLANLFMLSWPVMVLGGLRRFHARHQPASPAVVDWLLFGMVYMVWLATWSSRADLAVRIAAFAGGAAVLHLYAAVVLARFKQHRTSLGMRALIAAEILAGTLQLVRLVAALDHAFGGREPGPWLLGSGLLLLVPALLMLYVGLQLGHERNEARLRAVHRRLRFLADTDMLTLVPNRRHFHALCQRALALAGARPCALVMMDVDHFKRINDQHGHAFGDAALRQVGSSIRQTLRSRDFAGRLGGDEFGLLLTDTSSTEAAAVTDRLAALLARHRADPGAAEITLSFGVVEVRSGESIDDALARADLALYEAKRAGRNRAVVHAPAVPAERAGDMSASALGARRA